MDRTQHVRTGLAAPRVETPGPRQTAREIAGVVLAILLLAAASEAVAATFTVNSTADAADAAPGNGVCATAAAACTLRAAIQESNALAGADVIDFSIPLADAGYNPGTGVFTISVATSLPGITSVGTVIDATTQATNRGDTNPGLLGTGGTVGLGPDGKPGTFDEPVLPQVAAPEVELRDGAAVPIGLRIQSNNVTIRGLAILGFGTVNGEGAIVVDAGSSGTLIENNVIGSAADSFTTPAAAALRGVVGVDTNGAVGGTIRNNLIGFHAVRGIWLNTGSSGWTVSGNEIRDSGALDTTDGDGIAINGSGTNTITGNLIAGSSSQGYVVTAAGSTGNIFSDNTVEGNGVGTPTAVAQSAGVTFRASVGAASSVLERNLIRGNYGAGIQINDGASGIRITRNSLAGNGDVLPRGPGASTGQIGIDLNHSGDDANFGTAPFVTINDSGDGDAGANGLLNYPILETAKLSAGNLTLTGWALPNTDIEVFIAAAHASGFGEGESWIGTFTEGVADADGGSTTYGPGPINGLVQGTDTTNRFSFTVVAPPGVVAGTQLTATTFDGAGNTSEFGGLVTVSVTLAIVKRAFQDDGTPIASGSTLPSGMPVKFLLFIDNPSGAVSDLSLRDVLDPTFVYQASTMKLDNTLASSVVCPGGICDAAAIFAQVDGLGTALGDGDSVTAPIDADVGSYDVATRTIDVGDQNNSNNTQLNIAANSVLAVLFTVHMQ